MTIDHRPRLDLDAPDDPHSTAPVVRVFPTVAEPTVTLMLSTAADPYWPLRGLTPEEARRVARALTEAAEFVEGRKS